MCDTLAVKAGGSVWFAKNSDREPGEAQRVEFHPGARHAAGARLACTYIEIEQAEETLPVILSRPDWMWGAEMGVNAAGVAIGNEAVFSRRVLKRGEALLGMDLVRLALERAASAAEAVDVISENLERYGQGGPAGWRDKGFRYDNSFLIADGRAILVLETCGRDWRVVEAGREASISNAYLPGAGGFAGRSETWLRPAFGRARQRQACSLQAARDWSSESGLAGLAAILRTHHRGDGFSGGSNRDLCMHAAGPLRPSATTASMIVRLSPGDTPRAAFTGAPSPCIAPFLPAGFSTGWAVMGEGVWEAGAEARDRAARDPDWRQVRRAAIAAHETALLDRLGDDGAEAAQDQLAGWPALIQPGVSPSQSTVTAGPSA